MATTKGSSKEERNQGSQSQQFLDARAEWNERWGDLITRAKNWRVAFLLMAGLACIEGLALVEEMHRSHVVPFVVAVDHLNQVVAAGLATETGPTDPRLIRSQVETYITEARSISSDKEVLKSRLEHVFGTTVQPSPAYTFLVDYFRTTSPFEQADSGTVTVDVHNVTPISSSSYEVDWTETKRDKEGNVIGKEDWKGVLGIVISPPKDASSGMKNPLGIYVNSVTWSKSV
jgi:type IV secretory pathway TrbF-like protein